MTGIEEGPHTLRVEMCQLWSSGERLTGTSKEVTIEYHPLKKEKRLIRVPIIQTSANPFRINLSILSKGARGGDLNPWRSICTKTSPFS